MEIKSFVMPNSDECEGKEDVKEFFCPIDAIERASGLIFFSNLFKAQFGKNITRINEKPYKQGLFW